MSVSFPRKVGLIAGSGSLPRALRDKCLKDNIPFFIIGIKDHVDPDILTGYPSLLLSIGQVKKAIEALQHEKVTEVVFAGGIERPSFSLLKMDTLAIKWLAKFGKKVGGDDGLLRAITQEFESLGFKVKGAHELLDDVLTPPGVLGLYAPTDQDQKDIERGKEVVRTLGVADIGQAAIIEEGVVLALEAAEGTAEMVRRTLAYKRHPRGGILIKAAKPQQETRVDLPTIGPLTVEAVHACGLHGIALEAGRSLILEKDKTCTLANEKGVFIYGFTQSFSS